MSDTISASEHRSFSPVPLVESARQHIGESDAGDRMQSIAHPGLSWLGFNELAKLQVNEGERTRAQLAISGQLRGRLTGPVQFFTRLLEVWELDENAGAKLLGYEGVTQVRDLLSGAASLRGRDAKDRIRYLFEIDAALGQLFRDEAVELDWLRESRSELGGDNPLALLLEGSMENLLVVKQLVERISGR